jgi:hypothetical protein
VHEISWLVARRAEALHRDASEDTVPPPASSEGQVGSVSAIDAVAISDVEIEARGELNRAVLPRFDFVAQGVAASLFGELNRPVLPKFDFGGQGVAAALGAQLVPRAVLPKFDFGGQGVAAALGAQLVPRPVLPRFDFVAQGVAASLFGELNRAVLPRFDFVGQEAAASLIGQLPKFELPRFDLVSSTGELDVAFGAPPVHRVDSTTNRLIPGWLGDEESLRRAFRVLLATSGGCMFLGLFLVAQVDPTVRAALDVLAAEAGIVALLVALYALANGKPK